MKKRPRRAQEEEKKAREWVVLHRDPITRPLNILCFFLPMYNFAECRIRMQTTKIRSKRRRGKIVFAFIGELLIYLFNFALSVSRWRKDTKHFRFHGISCRNYFHSDFDRNAEEKSISEFYLNHVFDLHFRFSVFGCTTFPPPTVRGGDRQISVPRANCVQRWLSDSQAAGFMNGVNFHLRPNSPPKRAALDSPAITQALSLTASISINRALFKRSLRAYNHRTDSLSCWYFFRLCVSRSLFAPLLSRAYEISVVETACSVSNKPAVI